MAVTIGEIIKHYRTSIEMSQEDLSDGICTRRQISNIECNNSTPSLDLICDLSEKLNVNLLTAFGNVYHHNDLDAHLKYVELAKAISPNTDIETLKELVSECEKLPGFKTGEPKTLLAYAKSVIYISNKQNNEALAAAKEELCSLFPRFPQVLDASFNLPNVDYALLLSYAVFECRYGILERGLSILDEISSRVKLLLSDSLYDSEEKKDFWTSMWCSSVYNKFCFAEDSYENMSAEIDEILEYQKTNNRIHILPELLLCKTIILLHKSNLQDAYETYACAKAIGEFYYSKEIFEKKVDSLFNMNASFADFIKE